MTDEKKLDAIILEDDSDLQNMMRILISPDIAYVIVATSESLRKVLMDNPQTEIFVLDDIVPPNDSNLKLIHAQFINNATLVLEHNPGARIWYMGSMPSKKEIEFCKQHDIPMIEKPKISQILSQNVVRF